MGSPGRETISTVGRVRRVVGCALLVVLLAAGCTSGGPTLDEAAQVLAADAKKLESSYSMAGKKTVDKTGDENDDAAGCPGAPQLAPTNSAEASTKAVK